MQSLTAILVLFVCITFVGADEMNEDEEKSPSGSPILRHENNDRGFTAPEEHARNLEEIETHLEKHIGPVETVFHEIVSDLIHLDVLYIPPTLDRPFAVLATSGVSDLPMVVPAGAEEFARAELLIALPKDWQISDEAFKDESNYWPARWLKYIGRLPHEYNTWIGWGHTIPNGDPPEPIDNTGFVGVMLAPPHYLDPDFFQLTAENGDVVSFYELVPLYAEEMDLKLKNGADELERRFEKEGIGFVLDTERKNVAKSKGWFSR